jgi:hypothetical protein
MAKSTGNPEEVAYHPQYNKGSLRKVTSQFPASDVKKGLASLYKRAEKHFADEDGLLQVVWRGIQEDVLHQIEKMNDLIARCYGDAGIELDFKVHDVLGYFSEIARNR